MEKSILSSFAEHLRHNEKSPATIEKYHRYASVFLALHDCGALTKDAVLAHKEYLAQNYTAEGANGMISAVNSLLSFLGRGDLRILPLRIQRRSIALPERQLKRDEFDRLIDAARRQGKDALALVLRTMFATGIRVSELCYITVEAARAGQTEVRLKGKVRTILLPEKLCRLLLRFAKERKIAVGAIFLSQSGFANRIFAGNQF